MLNSVMLYVVMLSISAISGLMLNSVMPRVILPGGVVLNVAMLSVEAPLILEKLVVNCQNGRFLCWNSIRAETGGPSC